MKNIIKKHFIEIQKILQKSDELINKTLKISSFLKRKIIDKKKYMFMVMVVHLQMHHIL